MFFMDVLIYKFGHYLLSIKIELPFIRWVVIITLIYYRRYHINQQWIDCTTNNNIKLCRAYTCIRRKKFETTMVETEAMLCCAPQTLLSGVGGIQRQRPNQDSNLFRQH